MSDDLRAGDIMIGPMDGLVPGLFPVGAGQFALFLTRRWWRMVRSPGSWWRYRHVAVVMHDGKTIAQAMPHGVERVEIGQRATDPRYLFIRPDYTSWGVSGHMVAAHAVGYLGTPYNFLTYLKLAAGAFRMRFTEAWLRKHMSTRRDMMCSQHVDQSLADAGYHVFNDGRLPQDVVPAELADALLSQPGWFLVPGQRWTPNSERVKLK